MFKTDKEREEYVRETEELLNKMLLEFQKEMKQLEHVCLEGRDDEEEEIIVGENC